MNYSKYSYRNLFLLVLIIFSCSIVSCKKYLDEKPSKSQVVPSSLVDLQSLLDNYNQIGNGTSPRLLELVADNYYVNTADWQAEFSYSVEEPQNYIWDKDATDLIGSWQPEYQGPIYYSNIVLGVLPNIEINGGNADLWNNIKGTALFYRAFAFYELAQLYCKPYSSSASTDLGIFLKLTSNINEKTVRSTVKQTYDQIIADLKTAATLLPQTTIYSTRPNVAAAYGALARVFLSMGDYTNAGNYANLSLQQNNLLMDFNTINSTIPRFNVETDFFNIAYTADLNYYFYGGRIDSNLYNSYDNNDLRKSIFFEPNGDGTYGFIGGYYGNQDAQVFDGIVTDEMYLIRAECYARANNKDAALSDLNTLLQKRWKTGLFTNVTASDATDALNKILVERRKELIYRGVRWSDLRRFNLDGANITLKRIINGTTYTLPPNDPRWVMLIPLEVINASGIEQNPR